MDSSKLVIKMCLLLFVVVMLWSSKATAQSASCTSVLMGLTPCITYMNGMSSTPAAQCCSQLATMVQTQPQCLCSLLNGNGNLNQTLALQLPGACNVQTPANMCNAAAGPTSAVVAPVSSPASSPSDSSAASPQSGTGSKTVPTTKASTNGHKTSGGKTINVPVFVFSSALLASICNAVYGLF